MDGIGAAHLGHADNLIDGQVSCHRAHALSDAIGLVCFETVQAQLVLFGIDSHRAFSKFVGGSHHADCDFAPVGNEDLAEFGHGSRVSCGLPHA